MMRELMEAAISGDVEILKRAVATKRSSLLCQLTAAGENIIHLAAWNGKVDFIKKAMEILSADEIQVLLSQPDVDNWNPLHVAVRPRQKTEILEPILGFCKSHPRLYDDDKNKPWLALNVKKQTPLHVAMDKSDMHSEDNSEDIEECAMKILSMDMEWLCGIEDGNGNSPLFLAVQMGYSRVAEKILMSSFDYSHRGQNGSTPLHFAPKCSENVLRLLLEKHSGLLDLVDDEGLNVLHQWAEMAELWPLNLLLEGKFPAAKTKVFKDLICQMTEKSRNENPLYIASVKVKNTEGVKMLVRGYQQETQKAGETQPESIDNPPWKAQNKFGNTCLHGALSVKHEELALYFLSLDSTFLCQTRNNEGESALFAAVAFGCGHVVEEILRTQEISFKMLRRNDGATILHGLQYIPVDISRKLLEKFWWINNLQDNNKKTALDVAKEAKNPSLLDLLMEPSLIKKESFNWITACEKEEKEAVLAFINNCDDLDAAWRERNDTILHHIRLQTYKEYLNFLKIPSIAELKNTTDFDGATPLHRALERQDMNLAKALLVDNEVEPDIPDHLDRTALNMLAELCKKYDDWDKMCKQIKINPHFKTTYIQTRTNMDQMRNTLSVVAALLATITFAAGFTLPGGLESETGNAVLAKKAAFLVFLISDAFAMCASMLVLFCLIWSMVSARDMAYLLVDRSVWILMQALNGTVVAFMTGVYVVIEHSSLWAAIIIFVMCSLIGILAYKPILLNVLGMFIPAADHDRKDRYQMLEEGRASDSRNDQSRNSTSYLETKSALDIVLGKAMEDEAHLRQKIQKVVLKLDIQDNDNWKQKAMKLVSSMPGVNSISMDMEEKKMTVLGYMDPVEVLTKLRKNYCTDIISVGQVPGKGTAEAEDDDHKKA